MGNILQRVKAFCKNVQNIILEKASPVFNSKVCVTETSDESTQLLSATWHQPGGQSLLSSHFTNLQENEVVGHPEGSSLLIHFCLQLSKFVLFQPSQLLYARFFEVVVASVQDFPDIGS